MTARCKEALASADVTESEASDSLSEPPITPSSSTMSAGDAASAGQRHRFLSADAGFRGVEGLMLGETSRLDLPRG